VLHFVFYQSHLLTHFYFDHGSNYIFLENNPEVMNDLAAKLGLSKDLAFYDVYSFTDTDLLSLIPRPVYALLVIIPLTPIWHESRVKEDAEKEEYTGSGPDGSSQSRFINSPEVLSQTMV
jgi:ubiquitin carboxyl-terminal hydrolase L3